MQFAQGTLQQRREQRQQGRVGLAVNWRFSDCNPESAAVLTEHCADFCARTNLHAKERVGTALPRPRTPARSDLRARIRRLCRRGRLAIAHAFT